MFLSGVDYVSIKTVFTKRIKNRTFLCIHVWKETFFTHNRSNGKYVMPVLPSLALRHNDVQIIPV